MTVPAAMGRLLSSFVFTFAFGLLALPLAPMVAQESAGDAPASDPASATPNVSGQAPVSAVKSEAGEGAATPVADVPPEVPDARNFTPRRESDKPIVEPEPPAGESAGTSGPPRQIYWPIAYGFGALSNASFAGNDGGEFGGAFTNVEFGLLAPVGDDSWLRIMAEAKYADYRFADDALALGQTAPLAVGDAYAAQISAFLLHPLDERWAVIGGLAAGSGAEDRAAFFAGWDASIVGGIKFSPDDSLDIALTLAINFRAEEGAKPVPFIHGKWKITEHFQINAIGHGAELAINFDWSMDFLGEPTRPFYAYIGGEYMFREFRLNGQHASAAVARGFFKHQSFPIAVGFRFSPLDGVKAQLQVGTFLWQQLDIEAANRAPVAVVLAERTIFVNLAISLAIF